MKSAQIRESFLAFFEKQGHRRVASSSLIPAADPTLLFTNAGMVQFKDCFLGMENPGYRRATTSQKCVRAGGKHNDLENVGFTPRHHTFFEMLGNFSFGDYFKKDAIAFAWQLLTEEFKIPKERLRITIFETDDEAFELWKAQGIRPDWIERLGEKDNFWAMGDTGPCGPCTEIHFDWGEKPGAGATPGTDTTGRFLEIWNLVFMQYNRDAQGQLTPLPKPSVDTGAGLERVACVLQGVFSNYETDLFMPILQTIAERVGRPYGTNEADSVSMRVVADHLRSGTFLLADGVIPSNEGRGYVLRRILRRAIRHGKKLGQEKPFLYSLVGAVERSLGAFYPELAQNRNTIEALMQEEEQKFHETLHRGMGILEEAIRKTLGEGKNTLSGDVAFKLYDTFGFPFDLIQVIAAENKIDVDEKAFGERMDSQRSQSTFHQGTSSEYLPKIVAALDAKPVAAEFLGYEKLNILSPLSALFTEAGEPVGALSAGQKGFAIFSKTPFYAESGGQVGDKGTASSASGVAEIVYTSKVGHSVLHEITVSSGKLTDGDTYQLQVDATLRQATAINHTATHLLHAVLRKHLGERVKQAGSLVDPDRLRFDFSYPRAVSAAELLAIEKEINAQIASGHGVEVQEMAYAEALQSGALAFFDEKYGDRVRVVRIGRESSAPVSVELCGGTHLENISEIRLFKITSESSVASGVRRIEAVTATGALDFLLRRNQVLESIENMLGVKDAGTADKIRKLNDELKTLQRSKEKLELRVAQGAGTSTGAALWEKKFSIKDLQVVMETVPSVNPKVLRTLVDQVRDKLPERTIVVLASEAEGRLGLCVGLTKDLTARFDAGKLIQPLAQRVGGTGGGRADFAQAGGTKPEGISEAFSEFKRWLEANA